MYDEILVGSKDAQFELLDAVLLSERVGSFAELSLSPVFRRQWSSVYSALEEGSPNRSRNRAPARPAP